MKKEEKYIIGIDAGATCTEVVLYEFSTTLPQIFKWGKGFYCYNFPPINYNLLGKEKTIKRLLSILKDVTKKIELENISSIVIGIAGARHKDDRDEIKKYLVSHFKIKKIKILPDTEIAFASIFDKTEKNCGILIAGTGSILYYRDAKGKLKRVGGWGRHIGDEGSGYWIGKEALNRVTKYYDGLSEKTKLVNVLKKYHDLHSISLTKKIYHENFEISSLAKHVFDCAETGDKVSIKILKEAAEHLGHHFKVLKKSKMKIGLLGSLFTKEKLLEKYLKTIVKQRYPNIQIIKPQMKPIWGAIKLGMKKNISCSDGSFSPDTVLKHQNS